MKTVYIVFVSSNYRTGSLIRLVTGLQYNHVALALDSNLPVLHSFARCNYFEPFNAGYQQETAARYLVGNVDSKIKICTYTVTDEHYERIHCALADYQSHVADTCYNFADLLFYPLRTHIPVRRVHTCISFLSELLEFKRFTSLRQLERLSSGNVLYEGGIGAWVGKRQNAEKNYFVHRPTWAVYKDSMRKGLRLLRGVAMVSLALVLGIDLI